MTTRDRLRETCTAAHQDGLRIMHGDRTEPLTYGDARKLDALVAACIEEQRLMEIAGNVKPGIDAEAAWEAYDEAARATQAALAAITTPEAP